MPQINCYIPIKIRITGQLSDTQLCSLGDAIARAVAARIEFAERAIAAGRQGIYNPVREDADLNIYTLASYQKPDSHRLPIQRPSAARPWLIRKAINFHARVGNFLDYIEGLHKEPLLGKVVYLDLWNELRWVSLWLVQVNREFLLSELAPILSKRAEELSRVRSHQMLAYGLAATEDLRQQLIEIDQDGVVKREIPTLARNRRFVDTEGEIDARLRPGAWILFSSMVLPRIELSSLADLGIEIQVSVYLRDVTFLIPTAIFEQEYGLSWANYLQEFGNESAILRLQFVTVRRRVHFLALQYLVEKSVEARINNELSRPHTTYVGRLNLLNNSTLGQLASAVRTPASSFSNDLTRGIDEAQATDVWEPNWQGAYIFAVLTLSPDRINAARFRPEARHIADQLIVMLQGDPVQSKWAETLLRFLRQHYGSNPSTEPILGGSAFEFLLWELESRNSFNRLFEAVEASKYWGLHRLLIQLTLGTRHATHARVRQTIATFNTQRHSISRHIYREQEPEIWLDKNASDRVKRGDILVNIDSIYSVSRKAQRIKASRMPAFRQALEEEAQALFKRILLGQDTQQYNEESFARAVLGAAVQRIHLNENDIEEVKIERSLRLLGIELRVEEGFLERYYITYELVERVDRGAWETVAESRRTQVDGEFELLLQGWIISNNAVVLETLGIGVSIIGIIAIAWEAGIVVLLIEAAGGTTTVLISISLSELIYIYKVVFGDAKLSLEGFLIAALDGYLMALGFRGAGILGRGAAGLIGTASLERLIGGWVAERLIVGTVGGAGSAALTTFSHDLINVLSGRGSWSSPEDYVRQMAWGAFLGTVFEFGIGALQPILRLGGETGLKTLTEAVAKIREAGISPARWTAWMTEALGNLSKNFRTVFGEAMSSRLLEAFRGRIGQVTEQLGASYRLGVFRRVLELSPESLTRSSVEGLEKFLNVSQADLSNEAALAILNHLNPTQLRTFLEALNSLDTPILGALSKAGQLDILANSPYIASIIRNDPVISHLLLTAAGSSSSEAINRIRGIVGLARSLPIVPESLSLGAFFAEGGTSQLYEVAGRPDLLVKQGGGRLPVEAQSLVELELMGIDTVYAATRRIDGQTNIVVRRVDGVSSKDIIGRLRQPSRTPQNIEVVTQKTIDDLERIYRTLQQNQANVGDFQFIVRRSDGAVFVNDPVSVTRGGGPSGNILNITERFKAIWRQKQAGGK